MMWWPRDWRASAESRIRRSAPPMPRSGWRKMMVRGVEEGLLGDGDAGEEVVVMGGGGMVGRWSVFWVYRVDGRSFRSLESLGAAGLSCSLQEQRPGLEGSQF